jgi:NAD(P)-dependent dehydrogenase (short-subunit alcohol dehydrogenase family)
MADVVLITGAGTGIGRATAIRYAREGAPLILVGRRVALLRQVCDDVSSNGVEALPVPADLADPAAASQTVQMALARFGRIDVLVNNMGVAGEARLVHETPDTLWEEMLQVNLLGTIRLIRAVLPHFVGRRRGLIVNVSSMAALVGMPGLAAYSVAKSGLLALTRSVAVEYGGWGIRCNCLCPGTVATPMTEGFLSKPGRRLDAETGTVLGRIATPEEMAEVVFFLGSDRSSFITGAVLSADGGYTAR